MKKNIVFAISAISAFMLSLPVYNVLALEKYSADNIVILYATDWCSYCKKTRKFLNDNNIKYQEYDIEKSIKGRKNYHALGGVGVPVLHINGHVITGYNEVKILSSLNLSKAGVKLMASVVQ